MIISSNAVVATILALLVLVRALIWGLNLVHCALLLPLLVTLVPMIDSIVYEKQVRIYNKYKIRFDRVYRDRSPWSYWSTVAGWLGAPIFIFSFWFTTPRKRFVCPLT